MHGGTGWQCHWHSCAAPAAACRVLRLAAAQPAHRKQSCTRGEQRALFAAMVFPPEFELGVKRAPPPVHTARAPKYRHSSSALLLACRYISACVVCCACGAKLARIASASPRTRSVRTPASAAGPPDGPKARPTAPSSSALMMKLGCAMTRPRPHALGAECLAAHCPKPPIRPLEREAEPYRRWAWHRAQVQHTGARHFTGSFLCRSLALREASLNKEPPKVKPYLDQTT